jgi:hypothetical protein
MLNFGGPGWFNDVFECEIIMDDSARQVVLKGFLVDQEVPLYRSDEIVRGKLKITSPPNRTCWYYGISMELESSIQFYESLNSIQSGNNEIIELIKEPGSVTGTVEIPFEFDLSKFSKILDTYDGEKFDVRHSLLVTLKRPWYTFNVTRNKTIAIHNVKSAPHELASIPVQVASVPRDTVMEIDDCGGKVQFNYNKAQYNLGDVITGEIKVEVLEKPLTSVRVLLYKIEVADGDTSEKELKEVEIVSAVAEATCRKEPVVTGDVLTVSLPLIETELSPTYEELNEVEASVNVHYYLRLVVEDGEGKKSWNTHEVLLFRSKLMQGKITSGTEV